MGRRQLVAPQDCSAEIEQPQVKESGPRRPANVCKEGDKGIDGCSKSSTAMPENAGRTPEVMHFARLAFRIGGPNRTMHSSRWGRRSRPKSLVERGLRRQF
jgi:hypothetical protein